MTEIEFRSHMSLKVMDSMGDDQSVVRAARVSVNRDLKVAGYGGEQREWRKTRDDEARGLIEFLMKNRHGTPFEHNAFTFRIEAPIFVWREFHRHRIGISYNEMSSRYTQLPPTFYVPAHDRPLTQVGKPGAYVFVPGTPGQVQRTEAAIMIAAKQSYDDYEEMLADGIAREVARMVLPVNIYSVCYVTMNARSVMSFLSLRTKREDSTFPSYPQREIEMVAELIENEFENEMPLTWEAFNKFGRVAP